MRAAKRIDHGTAFNEMTNAQHTKGRLDPDKIEAEILANERTFLAWVRTSIAVMSLGFVIARFSLWMREMSSGVSATMRIRYTGISEVLGECMIGLGGVLTAFAAWRYRVVKSGNRTGRDRGRSAHGHGNHRHYSDRCCGCDCLYDHFDSCGMILRLPKEASNRLGSACAKKPHMA